MTLCSDERVLCSILLEVLPIPGRTWAAVAVIALLVLPGTQTVTVITDANIERP